MSNQLFAKLRYHQYGAINTYNLTKIFVILIAFLLFVSFQSFGQKKKETLDSSIYPDLAKILDDPLSESACDMIKIAYLDFKSAYINYLKKREKGFKKSKERQDYESEVWDEMINETDKLCRKEIVKKWSVRGFCGQIGARQYYSPC